MREPFAGGGCSWRLWPQPAACLAPALGPHRVLGTQRPCAAEGAATPAARSFPGVGHWSPQALNMTGFPGSRLRCSCLELQLLPTAADVTEVAAAAPRQEVVPRSGPTRRWRSHAGCAGTGTAEIQQCGSAGPGTSDCSASMQPGCMAEHRTERHNKMQPGYMTEGQDKMLTLIAPRSPRCEGPRLPPGLAPPVARTPRHPPPQTLQAERGWRGQARRQRLDTGTWGGAGGGVGVGGGGMTPNQ